MAMFRRQYRASLQIIFAFLLGAAFTNFYCGKSTTPSVKCNSPKLENIVPTEGVIQGSETTTSNSKKEEEIVEKVETTPATPTRKVTKRPYPPLVDNKDLVITPKKCPKNLLLLIVVVSSSRNVDARTAIRKSWGNSETSKKYEATSGSIRVVYVLGSDEKSDDRVTKEAERYKDVLRGNFDDVYRQNEYHSVKTLLAFKWATKSCKSQFILKVYSESFVNVPTTMEWLKGKIQTGSDGAEGLYTGFCHGHNTGGASVIRNKESPWYISEKDWTESRLPPYASGMGVVLSYDVMSKMAELSDEEAPIPIEDVFLGILAKKLSLSCQDETSRFDTTYNTMLTECDEMKYCVLGGVPTKDMSYLNQNVMNLKEICSGN